MTYTTTQLKEIIEKHRKWRFNEAGGEKANLSRADLSGADLSGACLSRADLSEAYLSRANLSGADLSGADLNGANLSRANLSGAYLSRADLSGANFSGADLSRAYLNGAYLNGANLSRAYLNGAYLNGANLSDDTRMPAGETWAEYKKEVLPELLKRGKPVPKEAWACHDWENCPMHAAFDITSADKGPKLLVPRIKEFVQLFDAGLITEPK